MVWAIVLKKSNKPFIFSRRFQTLRWQLLGYSLAIMMGINLTSSFLVYHFFANSLYQQIDQRLDILANSAAHSLAEIKKDQRSLPKTSKRRLDHDQDLDLPWQNLQQSDQGIEWFNEHQQLLGQSGKIHISHPLVLGFLTINQKPSIRLLTIPVYEHQSYSQKLIIGYVRVAESTEEIDSDLYYLFWGFSIGMVVTSILIGLGGMWLTKKSLQPLAQSYEQLKQFTGDASHELRSPLTAIKTSVEVLQTHPERIHPQDIEKLANIISATNQIGHLVEDLLLLARTDNELDILPQSVSLIPLEEVIEDVITFLEPKAEQKFIEITLICLQKPTVKGDAFQLQRLFTNLIDNAIKYSSNHSNVNVTLQIVEKWATITIEDTGIGIAPQDLPFVFDRFWRAEKARSPTVSSTGSQTKGSGLGLAIAQSLAKANGGEIIVKSTLGQGSCFTIRLPLESRSQQKKEKIVR